MNLGHYLATLSERTVWIDYNDVTKRVFGTFNPNAPFSDFEGRYGVGSAHKKGDLVGERFSEGLVIEVLNSIQTPFPDLVAPAELTIQDRTDLSMLSYPQGSASTVYDKVFLPRYQALHPTEPLPPVEPPFPPIPPTPPAKLPPRPSARIMETARIAPAWSFLGTARRSRLAEWARYTELLDAYLEKAER